MLSENPFGQKEQGVCFAVACERYVGFQPAGSKPVSPNEGRLCPLADGAGECEARASSNAGEEIEEEAAEIPAVRPQAVACSVGESLGLMVPSTRRPWTGSVALRCHPWRGRSGSMSSSHCNCSGRAPAANSCQEGAWNPAAARCSPEERTPAKWKEGC